MVALVWCAGGCGCRSEAWVRSKSSAQGVGGHSQPSGVGPSRLLDKGVSHVMSGLLLPVCRTSVPPLARCFDWR